MRQRLSAHRQRRLLPVRLASFPRQLQFPAGPCPGYYDVPAQAPDLSGLGLRKDMGILESKSTWHSGGVGQRHPSALGASCSARRIGVPRLSRRSMRMTRIPVKRSSKVTLFQESIIRNPIGPAARRKVRSISRSLFGFPPLGVQSRSPKTIFPRVRPCQSSMEV